MVTGRKNGGKWNWCFYNRLAEWPHGNRKTIGNDQCLTSTLGEEKIDTGSFYIKKEKKV